METKENKKTVETVHVNVTVKRTGNHRIHEVLLSESKLVLGSVFVGRGPLRPLTMEEETILLPQILNIEKTDLSFRTKVDTFWADFMVEIPIEGLRLNASYDLHTDENGVEVRIPLNTRDFLDYAFLKEHPWCAPNLEMSIGNSTAKCYISDHGKERAEAKNILDVKKKVRKLVIQLTEDKSKKEILEAAINQLRAKAIISEFVPANYDDLLLLVEKYSEKFPAEFLAVLEDPIIIDKAFVQSLLENKVVTAVGNAIYDETIGNEAIADSHEGFIKYFKDPKNNAYHAALKQRLKLTK